MRRGTSGRRRVGMVPTWLVSSADSAAAYCVERVEDMGGGSDQRRMWVILRRILKSVMGWMASAVKMEEEGEVGLREAEEEREGVRGSGVLEALMSSMEREKKKRAEETQKKDLAKKRRK
ncbi:hypothetical protein BLNAU_3937 [Blattamonas nauphoetae]|uniref:Uncharacterized protein n=1 Tax=Blattamonas nauphoetae TaxID=2049346 RepID=A0ABQ9YBR1_9EUKA|nr:hypothetical protein BLNAU_3937 [Blattamonas nauphoetae]